MSNTRFSVAVHMLTVLCLEAGKPVSSEVLASSVNTNAALIRRLLSQLSKANLTYSERGTSGGAKLAKPAGEITLLDVRCAIEGGDIFKLHLDTNPLCPIGRNIQAVMSEELRGAQEAYDKVLSHTTILQLVLKVEEHELRRKLKPD